MTDRIKDLEIRRLKDLLKWSEDARRATAVSAWDEGYACGVRDTDEQLYPTKNPYRV